ncbi:hypothetical protein G7054_g6275 [Neopestalotiopsis clavispora]|nr:hypothetical protein G7054_g6275 [Neopestalotiopsis clavispora]
MDTAVPPQDVNRGEVIELRAFSQRPDMNMHYLEPFDTSSPYTETEYGDPSMPIMNTAETVDDHSISNGTGQSHRHKNSRGRHPTTKENENEDKYTWTLEFAALALSLTTLTAIISLLSWVNGRPLAEWRFYFSLNTVISVLATAFRASFAFILGSFLSQAKWNWFRQRSDNLVIYERIDSASRGPLTTIALIAFEPFTQAIVYYSGQTELPGTILGANSVSAGIYEPNNIASRGAVAGVSLPGGDEILFENWFLSRPDIGLVSSVLNGFDQQYSAFQLTPPWTCPSQNCTWSTFTSLAICSRCSDVSSHLEKSRLFLNSSRGTIGLDTTLQPNPNSTLTRYSLPLVELINLDGSSGDDWPYNALMGAFSTTNPGQTISFPQLDTMLATFQIIRAPPSFIEGNTVWEESQLSGLECAFHFCTQAYQSTVNNAELDEQILGSWSMRVPESYAFKLTNQATSNLTTLAEYEKWNNYSLVPPVNENGDPLQDIQREDLQLAIPQEELNRLMLSNNATMGAISDIVIQGLYGSSDLNATFEQVARSMTNWMRHSSGIQYHSARKDLLVEIRWWYLALPCLTLLSGCVFALLSVLETKRLKHKPWKDDIVFELSHALTLSAAERLRAAEREHRSAKEVAKQMTVRLVEVDGIQQLGETAPMR